MKPEEIAANIGVFHQANPARIGLLTGQRLDTMFVMAEVDWGNSTEYVDVSQLVRRQPGAWGTSDADVLGGRYGTIEDLRRRMTFEKLRGLLTDVFYSMKTSEIDFYPHQFKPVLRFIESATSRLLIADEVGLGKTIEAGLIWTEWQAREKARRLLVVCPPTLVPKWLRELQERFQFAAEATDASQLLELIGRFDRRGPGLSFALVTSYHAIRPLRLERDELSELSPEETELDGTQSARVRLLHRVRVQGKEATDSDGPRFLDMVVFDEAHSMKNTASTSYYAGEILSGAASAAVCLTATPIHNESRDLYALLRLIDPEVFRDEVGFDQLRQQNLPIVALQNAMAASGWQLAEIRQLAAQLPMVDNRTQMEAALARFDGTPGMRTELRRTAERMNLLGNFINRTRKRDVIQNLVLRQPITLPVSLSAEEFAFYRGVLELIRSEVRRRGERVTSFHLIHPALRMSSCLPVVASEVRRGAWGGFDEMAQLSEDYSDQFDPDATEALPPAETLRSLATHDFEKRDSKYSTLLVALRHIESNRPLQTDRGTSVTLDPKDKVIVFAFFKDTIAYLQRRLDEDGLRTVAVTGDIQDRRERDRIFRQFGSDENRILLCSEVGAEGVDLQFARVIVNYDLPWNPMRVEQRIGRIDRIGQKSANIIIINFNVLGTIDGSIYNHLYRKIGIFEQSIGALESILGDAVAKLTAEIFREDLTLEQIAERAEQTADAVCQQAEIAADLEESTGALVALQDILSEQVGESQRLGRFVKPGELRTHLGDFLARRYSGSDACLIVPDNPAGDCLELVLSQRAISDFEQYCNAHELAWPDGFSRAGQPVQLTFDPLVHQQTRPRFTALRLVTHLHPLVRWITSENEAGNNEWHKVSAVRLQSSDYPAGKYFYAIYRMSMEGITRRDAFHFAVKSFESSEVMTGVAAEALINQVLESGESLFPRDPTDHTEQLRDVRKAITAELKMVQEAFRADQNQKLALRRQQLESHYNRRIEIQRRIVATTEARPTAARGGLAGFRAKLTNLEAKRNEQVARLRQRGEGLKESFAEVACGIIEVAPRTS